MAISLFPVVVRCYGHLLTLSAARRGRKPQVCRRNCSDICHTVGYISTSGLRGHIVSGCPSMSHLFVDTFFEFGVVENFVYRARITVILILQIYSAVWVCYYDYAIYHLDDDLLLLPIFPSSWKCTKYRSSYSCLVIVPFSVFNIQKCHICEVYIFALQAYNAGGRKTSHVDVTSEPAT